MTLQARILVVDDDASLLRLLSMWLTAAGYAVDTVENGEQALTRIATFQPHVVVTDLRMDGMDGPAPGGGWAPYPVAAQDEHPGRTAVGDDGLPLRDEPPTPVVRLGALCGLRCTGADDATTHSFWVSEMATLADGRRVVLHEERGFTVGVRGAQPDLRRRSLDAAMGALEPGDIAHRGRVANGGVGVDVGARVRVSHRALGADGGAAERRAGDPRDGLAACGQLSALG